LAAAHARNLIHRDIKPANLWLEAGQGRVKILDFGLARVAGDDTHLTQTGVVVGTPRYMAPEQACGEKVDQRSDLFSLGCVLYRMSTGELPFQGPNTIAILQAVALGEFTPVREVNPQVPRALADLVMKLLAKDPKDRPSSARAVADALRSIRIAPSAPAAVTAEVDSDKSTILKHTLIEVMEIEEAGPARRSRRKVPSAGGFPAWAWAVCSVSLTLMLVIGAIAVYALNSGDEPKPKKTSFDPGWQPAGWQRFSPPGKEFSVLLPGKPSLQDLPSKTTAGKIITHMYSIKTGQRSYAAAYAELAGIVPQPDQVDKMLEGGRNGVLQSLPNCKLLAERNITLNGHRGKELQLQSADGATFLKARMYLAGQHLYQAMIQVPAQEASAPEIDAFFASFQIPRP
jgi:hypothetical protein